MVAQRDALPVPVFVCPLACNEWTVSGSRRRESGRRQQKHVESWVSEALGALNWLNGRRILVFATFGRQALQALALPPCSVASARCELRLARLGHDLQPSKSVLYSKGSVAVPRDAVRADLDSVLTGETKDMWVVRSRRAATCVSILTLLGVTDANGASGKHRIRGLREPQCRSLLCGHT